MRRTALLAIVVSALMSPTGALGYSFGDWASDNGYSPGAAMPASVGAIDSSIDSLDGIGDYNWTATPTTGLNLKDNQISSIESGDFSGLSNLRDLTLNYNPISSIESGDFNGLTNLENLFLISIQLSSIESGAFSGLTNLTQLVLNVNQISSIEAGAFSDLPNLTLLGLWNNQISSIEPGNFSDLPNLAYLQLNRNRISSIESEDFSGLPNLTHLFLDDNQISSIESGAFSGLPNLTYLGLDGNLFDGNTALTELNLSEADFSSLIGFSVRYYVNITSVSLKNVVVNQTSLATLLSGNILEPQYYGGIGDLDGISEMDLSGIDFGNITDLGPLYVMDDLTDLWLVDTVNLDATDLDVLLDNLATIEGTATEGVLYLTQANYDALNTAGSGLLATWHGESGHHVELVLPGDLNEDGFVDGADTGIMFGNWGPTTLGYYDGNINGDGFIDAADFSTIVANWTGDVGPAASSIPEPSSLLLVSLAGCVLLRRRRRV